MRDMNSGKTVRWLTVAACVGMFLVQLMGATVTQTESGRGCGDDWPLCNGKFVPDYTITSIIEYSHRVVSAVVGLLILAAAIAVFRSVKRREPRLYAGGALFFTVLQGGLGAAQVLNPQSEEILALHFGFSLLAFTCTLLAVTSVREYYRGSLAPQRSPRISAGYRWSVWLATVYSYIVVYTGAYTSHTDSGGGCAGFPLCNGQVVPAALEGTTAVAFMHRTAAFLLFAVVLALAIYTWRKYGNIPRFSAAAAWSLLLVVLQVASGALMMVLMGTDSYVLGTLLHTMIITVLFAVLSYMSVAAFKARR